MPERIAKGPILRALDKRYADTAKRDRAFQRLTDPQNQNKDVAEIGAVPDQAGETVLSQPNKAHIQSHWFDLDGNGWWKGRPVDKILKHGLRTALEEAAQRNVPIKTLWICSGDQDTGPFEVYVYPTDVQVTLILFSPNLPRQYYADVHPFQYDDIWVIKRIDTSGAISPPDGPKEGDCELMDLGGDFKIVKRRPKVTPDP
ncbi:MAG: hypothetical protein HYZ50_00865 [Deltaproteobacteria bacterium]|nr:hypothetical protein [Deltaproteobacteria bacterium]